MDGLNYLDNAATTPLAAEVRAAMEPFLSVQFGNPSARHPMGVRASEALDQARERVARALGARASGVIFTSGATEANNLAVLGLARAAMRAGRHVLIGPCEHVSVRAPALELREEGFEVEELRLDGSGALDLDDCARRLRPDTVLVAQMLVSNEFGTVYPVRELSALVRRSSPRAVLHVDAVQALGRIDCALLELGADSVSLSAHKLHGPKGAGALVMARELPLKPLAFGGGQERGLRPGTEHVAGLVGLGVAVELAERLRSETCRSLARVFAAFEEGLQSVAGARLFSPGRAAGRAVDAIAGVLVPGAPAEVWMHHLEARGVLVGTGSACQAAKKEVSPALLAAGLSPEEARRFLRFSFARTTTPQQARSAAEALAGVQRAMGALAP